MKRILFLIIAISLGFVNLSQATESKNYDFKFSYKNEVLKINQEASSYDSAYKIAAKSCFEHFKNKKKLSNDEGLSIIDICANP